MNWDLRRYGLAIGCTAVMMAAVHQPARAAQTEITGVQLTPTGKGFELILKIQGNSRPPVFTVNRGNASVADISNAQLRLPSGSSFSQPSPAPGINGIEMRQLDASTVRITVQGSQAAPVSDTIRRDDRQGLLVLRFNAALSLDGSGGAANNTPSQGPGPNPVPPFVSRPVAPPVGDMVAGSLNVDPDAVDLNSAQVIPKLLLRNAPVREVLTLLGRAANVNVAFADAEAASDPNSPTAGGSGSTISLDIENESVQDVFNYVLRLSGLQANKVGNTVFVGKELPGDAQNRIVRTLRLNQLRATGKVTFNNALVNTSQVGGSISGASASITSSGDDASASISGGTSGSASASALSRLSKYSETFKERGAKEILESYGANDGKTSTGQDQDPPVSDLLKGLQVVADARINSVTLIGTPRKVEIATNILQQLDLRKRQAAINVKIVDVNLSKAKNSNADLQYRVNDSLGFGFRPTGEGTSGFGIILGGANAAKDLFTGGLSKLTNTVLGSLLISIQNDDAKILTNPTLIIQEGSSAQVNLTQEIFSGLQQTTTTTASDSGGSTTSTALTPIIRQAGVIFNVSVDRIDDNGFLTFSVSPEVSAPSGQFNFTFPGSSAVKGTLLNQRRLETGKIRLRDGQTLVLTGIIQDTDKTTVSKVPILGDIPILGQLFRQESGEKSRRELVVLVTPRVMDDSQDNAAGYQYAPSPSAQGLLNK
ncbi:MAG: AMIN domain-containing protein [Thermosynechococcaceae cyanobacterium]